VERGRQDLPENPLHPGISPDRSGLALDRSPYLVLAFCPELGGLEVLERLELLYGRDLLGRLQCLVSSHRDDEPVYQTDPLDPLMRCCASAAIVARPERKPTAVDAPLSVISRAWPQCLHLVRTLPPQSGQNCTA
jgi:hypothetical protein